MNKIFLIILVLILAIITFFAVTNTYTLKEVRFGQSSLEVVSNETENVKKTVNVRDKNLIQEVQVPKVTPKNITKEPEKQNIDVKDFSNIFSKYEFKKNEQKTKPVVMNNVEPKSVKQIVKKDMATKVTTKQVVQKNVEQPKSTPVKKEVEKAATTPKIIKKTNSTSPKKKNLTEYEETIAWNQWRANVSNAVAELVNSNFSNIVPQGTIYSYSFNVSSKGRISDVVAILSRGYNNPSTSQGRLMIEQAILSLNGNSILTFPEGTQRTSVNVAGAIERSQTSSSVNANQFNDTETIKKTKYE